MHSHPIYNIHNAYYNVILKRLSKCNNILKLLETFFQNTW